MRAALLVNSPQVKCEVVRAFFQGDALLTARWHFKGNWRSCGNQGGANSRPVVEPGAGRWKCSLDNRGIGIKWVSRCSLQSLGIWAGSQLVPTWGRGRANFNPWGLWQSQLFQAWQYWTQCWQDNLAKVVPTTPHILSIFWRNSHLH